MCEGFTGCAKIGVVCSFYAFNLSVVVLSACLSSLGHNCRGLPEPSPKHPKEKRGTWVLHGWGWRFKGAISPWWQDWCCGLSAGRPRVWQRLVFGLSLSYGWNFGRRAKNEAPPWILFSLLLPLVWLWHFPPTLLFSACFGFWSWGRELSGFFSTTAAAVVGKSARSLGEKML